MWRDSCLPLPEGEPEAMTAPEALIHTVARQLLRGLRESLRRSQEYLGGQLAAILEPDRPIDEALYQELEELLIAADLGVEMARLGNIVPTP